MNTDTIKDALTVEIEWQDSAINDGSHRLLGKTANLNVEIIPDTSVTLAYTKWIIPSFPSWSRLLVTKRKH
jgi:hypothetical protein